MAKRHQKVCKETLCLETPVGHHWSTPVVEVKSFSFFTDRCTAAFHEQRKTPVSHFTTAYKLIIM